MTAFPARLAEQSPGTLSSTRTTLLITVVGFDGNSPAMRALDGAVDQLRGREGSIEIVHVAASSSDTPELSEKARDHLLALEPRWHFQHRDGRNVAEGLVAIADEFRQRYGPEANIFIIVGSSAQHRHRVATSLVRGHRYPVLVVP
jgi:hypothetical protein